jgi:lipopolysaccharide biosynthesis glycosyltransferase
MRYAIVTATDSRYLPAACCALLSCVGDGEAAGQARLFLLAYDISAVDAKNANAFLRSQGAEAEIFAVGADSFQKFRIDGYVSASTYSRLLLQEFFDDQWDRLLYVDADMRVMATADRRFQSDGRRVRAMSAALPATDRRLPQD